MTYWQQMSILLWFWSARGIGAADERLTESEREEIRSFGAE